MDCKKNRQLLNWCEGYENEARDQVKDSTSQRQRQKRRSSCAMSIWLSYKWLNPKATKNGKRWRLMPI
jgi:hypothetical protein